MKPIVGMYGIQDRQPGPTPLETHDHALCRMEDGSVVEHIALERHTRRRHDNRLHAWIEALAPNGYVAPGEDVILACADSFVGRSFISASGQWRIEAAPASALSAALVPARAHVYGREQEAWIVPHELAHVGASLPFLGGWEDGTLLVHIDGAASLSCCSAWEWANGVITPLTSGWDLAGPVGGYATNNLAQALVGHTWREFLQVPGKLMALAAYGQPDPELAKWLARHDWFARLRGGPDGFIDAARRDLGWDGTLSPSDPLVCRIAACFQKRFEDAVVDWIAQVRQRSGARRLVLSGGGALNLPTNQRICDLGWFDEVFVPPCPGDDGLALGAAAMVTWLQRGALDRHSPFLNTTGAPSFPREPEVVAIADALARGEIVATCLGPAEMGPRALGRRSLLGLPSIDAVRRISVTAKGREPWRPVAPMVLAELAGRLFLGAPERSNLAPYMLGRFTATDLAYREAPGIVHVDGTARVQTVGHEPELQPIRRLLEALWQRHGIPCLANTSFNTRGEPLVQTLAEARTTASALGADKLWHGHSLEDVATSVVSPAEFDAVASDLVSWRTEAVHAAVTSGLIDRFPLGQELAAEPEAVRRLVNALGELGLARRDGVIWVLTSRGRLLADDHPQTLGPAAKYWAEAGRAAWAQLPAALRDTAFTAEDPFAAQANLPEAVRAYHRAMMPYACRDYRDLPAALERCDTLLDAGGGLGVSARLVLDAGVAKRVVVLDRPEVVALGSVPPEFDERLSFTSFDLFQHWPDHGDAILLARVLHDWDDAAARTILRHARAAIGSGGRVYIVEMVRPEQGFEGSLLDLHMLLATGGRERTRAEFAALLADADLKLTDVRPLRGISSVIIAEPA